MLLLTLVKKGCFLLCIFLLLVGCENNNTSIPDNEQIITSIEPGIVEPEDHTMVESDDPDALLTEISSPTAEDIPNILYAPKYDSVDGTPGKANYIYLTDGSNTTPWTLVREGDMFLGFYAEHIEAYYFEYEDESIAYTDVLVEFKGEVEIMADLEYFIVPSKEYHIEIIGSEFYEAMYATVAEKSWHLLPAVIVYPYKMILKLSKSDIVDELIRDGFNGESGTIENCKIVIQDFALEFNYSDAMPFANLISVEYSK